MLTFRETDTVVAADKDSSNRTTRLIYYYLPNDRLFEHTEDTTTDRFTCGFCKRSIKRKSNFHVHLKGCTARIIIENIASKDFEEYTAQNRLELMMPYNPEKGLRMYISGPPGCGKSYLIGQTIREYTKQFPKRVIYLFSAVDSDRAIDGVIADIANRWNPKRFKRIDLSKLMDIDLDIEEFRGNASKKSGRRVGSLCIFDDIDKIPDKELRKRIDSLKDAIHATGRDHEYRGGDIDIIVSNHLSLDSKRTQELLNQASYLALFPHATSDHHIKTICMKYCGLSKDQVDRITQTQSRYVIIHRDVPIFVLEERKVWLVK